MLLRFVSRPLRMMHIRNSLYCHHFFHTQRSFVVQQVSYISILSRISYCGSPTRKPLLIKALVREDIVGRWGHIPVMKF